MLLFGIKLTLVSNRYINTVKPVLSGHPRDPRYCPLNRGVPLVQVHFTENKGIKIIVFTEAGVRLMQGVHLIRGLLNTGFTVGLKSPLLYFCY